MFAGSENVAKYINHDIDGWSLKAKCLYNSELFADNNMNKEKKEHIICKNWLGWLLYFPVIFKLLLWQCLSLLNAMIRENIRINTWEK